MSKHLQTVINFDEIKRNIDLAGNAFFELDLNAQVLRESIAHLDSVIQDLLIAYPQILEDFGMASEVDGSTILDAARLHAAATQYRTPIEQGA